MRLILWLVNLLFFVSCAGFQGKSVSEKDIPKHFRSLWQAKVKALGQQPKVRAFLENNKNTDLTNNLIRLSLRGKTHARFSDLEFKRKMMQKVTRNMSEDQCVEYFSKSPKGIIGWFNTLSRSLTNKELKRWVDISGRFIELGVIHQRPFISHAKNFKLAIAELRIFSDVYDNRKIDEFFQSMMTQSNEPKVFCEFSRVLYRNSDRMSIHAREEIFKNFSFETIAVSENWL